MGSEVVEVVLPNGVVALVLARQVDGGGATKTAFGRLDLKGVAGTLEGVSEAIRGAVVKASPSKVSVELGLELAVKGGALVGLLVDGDAKGSLKVKLEWEPGKHLGSPAPAEGSTDAVTSDGAGGSPGESPAGGAPEGPPAPPAGQGS